MIEVLHANVFFFITAIAVIVLTMLLCVALYHVIKILKSIRMIIDRIEEGSELIAEDMSHLRTYFNEGSLISKVAGVFFNRFGVFGGTQKKKRVPTKRTPRTIKKRPSINAKITVRDAE